MRKGRRQAVRHGYVILDKPPGWTSHDVVARVRRIVDERRVGHAGTLDPAATGVLPVAIGLATRTVEYLASASKAYRAWITFGVTTDSADAEGRITSTGDVSGLTIEAIRAVLPAFTGDIWQRPPMHSAIKIDGKRLYELARRDIEIEVPLRQVVISRLTVVEWDSPVLCLDVECSKGTYIRSLARDLGERVGTGAYLSRLVRTRTGPFDLESAISLDQLADAIAGGAWDQVARPPDAVLDDLPRIDLDPEQVIDWRHGKSLPAGLASGDAQGNTIRAYDRDGHWLGIGSVDQETGVIRPAKVVALE